MSRGSIRNESILHTIMSIVDVKVPQLSESVAEATLLQWKKQAGQAVAADEVLIEIETDKVVLEVPAPAGGVLIELVVASGGTVSSDQLIARIDTQAKADVTALPVAPSPKAASTAPQSLSSFRSTATRSSSCVCSTRAVCDWDWWTWASSAMIRRTLSKECFVASRGSSERSELS